MTSEQRDALCNLTVQADGCCPEIISHAHALYYYGEDGLSDWRISSSLDDIRTAIDKLTEHFRTVEQLFRPTPRVASNTVELMQQLRDSVALCDAENAP